MAKRQRRPAKSGGEADAQPAAPVPKPEPEGEPGLSGRLLSEVDCRLLDWLWHPWIPRGLLTLLVGEPAAGKSTFLACLIAYVTSGFQLGGGHYEREGRVVLLPGQEECMETLMAPRLKFVGVRADRVRILDQPGISLLRDKKRIAREVLRFGASLLVGDPIDSYVDDGFSEDKGQQVRPLLEAAVWIAQETNAAVLFARHPGKDPGNLCPGSRQWRAVPKVILSLVRDGESPPTGLLAHWKPSLGTDARPHRYTLDGKAGEPRRFRLDGPVEASAEEIARLAGGPTGRYKVMAACRLIRWLFESKEEVTRQQLGEEGRKLGIGEDTVNDALRLLSIKSVPPAERGLPWLLVRRVSEWPAWLPRPGEG